MLKCSSSGVLPYAFHPSTNRPYVLMGLSKARNRWEMFGGARDPWSKGENGLETIEWTAARELSEETLGLIGGTKDGKGVQAVCDLLCVLPPSKVHQDPDSASGFTAYMLKIDWNDSLPNIYEILRDHAHPSLPREMIALAWVNVDEILHVATMSTEDIGGNKYSTRHCSTFTTLSCPVYLSKPLLETLKKLAVPLPKEFL